MKKLKQIIKDKGLQQYWVGKKIGVSEGTISSWVTGRNKPTTEQVGDLAEFLGVPVAEICDEIQ